MTRRDLLAIGITVPLAACGRKRKRPKPPLPPNSWNYLPPVWDVRVSRTGVPEDQGPNATDFRMVFERVTSQALQEAEAAHHVRPPRLPGPGEHAAVHVELWKTCGTSADYVGDGLWGMRLKAYSCTEKTWWPKNRILSIACMVHARHIFAGSAGSSTETELWRRFRCGG
jgi:hypothetical protein